MIVNMRVDLSASFATDGEAALLIAAGLSLEHRHGVAERDSAWIRSTFGGEWHSESESGWNWLARKADGELGGFCTYGQSGRRWWWLARWQDAPGVGIFGPMGVDKAVRGKQIGRVLARRALASMKSLGLTTAIIGAVGPVDFYEHCCGAVVIERLARPL
ncbi:MAG TPA: GNAT family N-acetyltransferase [Candidatus Eremiobacteraceae bacterium]|nr:GNAT family N-acetyltransferase [Candidatus Eremiobacteraceae bacterium]